MFIKILKYHIISNVRQKENFFWTLLFPIILATFFFMTFSSLDDLEKTTILPVAVVDTDGSGEEITSILKTISLFEINETDKENADDLLSGGKVDAIINIEKGDPSLFVMSSDYTQNIIKSIFDQISQTSIVISDMFSLNPDGNVSVEALNLAQSSPSYIKETGTSNNDNDVYSIYFFALIAMACMFSAQASCYSVINIQGNQSDLGARQCISPSSKIKIFGANFLGDTISQYASVVILLLYIKHILKYNIGDLNGWMFLFAFVSVFTSLSLGSFLSAVLKVKANTKTSIITAICLISCGMAGLYQHWIKVILEDKMSLIKYINPGTLISDGLISLYYYDSLSRYFIRIAILGVFGIILFAGTCIVLRRQRYDSI